MAKSKRKFYKTVIKFVVLSEDPISNNMSLDRILEETDSGDMVGHVESRKSSTLNSQEIVGELDKAGSDSTFFQLTEDGEDDK